jgi:hypothetical protein
MKVHLFEAPCSLTDKTGIKVVFVSPVENRREALIRTFDYLGSNSMWGKIIFEVSDSGYWRCKSLASYPGLFEAEEISDDQEKKLHCMEKILNFLEHLNLHPFSILDSHEL